MFPLHPQLQNNYNRNQQSSSLMDGWKTTLTWCYNDSYIGVEQYLFLLSCNWVAQVALLELLVFQTIQVD